MDEKKHVGNYTELFIGSYLESYPILVTTLLEKSAQLIKGKNTFARTMNNAMAVRT
ncbi:Uncharacterised protein [Yersinia kristensenii]|nr:Uncharacterised protein [Yersinia kristensenii]CNK01321.1 Uncharacterised protein [Yersinia kristensenii]